MAAVTIGARDGLRGNQYYYEHIDVAIASNSGAQSVTFSTAFTKLPHASVIVPRGAAGSYFYSSLSTTGIVLRVSGESDSDYNGHTIPIFLFVHER